MLVVLIEDYLPQRDMCRQILIDMGYRVEDFALSEDALEFVTNDVSLLLTDLEMPDQIMDGFGLIREIRRRFPKMPIILMTGCSQDKLTCLESYQLFLLRKPFTPDQLETLLKEAVSCESHASLSA